MFHRQMKARAIDDTVNCEPPFTFGYVAVVIPFDALFPPVEPEELEELEELDEPEVPLGVLAATVTFGVLACVVCGVNCC